MFIAITFLIGTFGIALFLGIIPETNAVTNVFHFLLKYF